MGWRLASLGIAAAMIAGCGKGTPELAATTPPPAKDPYASWPKDTLTKPDEAGAVQYEAPRDPEDAEALRVSSQFMLPDWVKETAPLTYSSPKGARIEIHFLQRDESLRKAEDAKVARMVAGAKEEGRSVVIARPWRGWYGEANSARSINNKAVPCRMRIYTLFHPERQLELHLEWPKESPQAQKEANAMAAHVIYSIHDLEKKVEG